ncbi:MAG: hypothetical protein GTN62_06715, partial [Gemmatimonadales bacterium]|nr:hypothetical protein [Gemmatimonadales bacterium]NIN11190.1 hypothetical protein [Gemmatimonadales bacterium]NIN49789.1 hypothetical protein [Gemmatimonadales bacterium]NIP07253.1 hypothetical protein [Gemmatimonadales bacterium]NIR00466.1 hypothetical protein [Gemmatimonadales bacterium]
MSTIASDLRHALRKLAKSPGFATVVVLTLAVGIAANVAMFGVMNAALIRPLPFADPDRLVLGRATIRGGINPHASAHDYYDYRDRSQVFESLATILPWARSVTITGGDQPERVSETLVSVDLFGTLGISPQIGRHFAADEGEPEGPAVALLAHGYWQRRFGGAPEAVGQTLIIDGYPHTVVGVMPPGFQFMPEVDMWRPMRRGGPFATARRFHNWLLVGRLKPGVSIEQAQ